MHHIGRRSIPDRDKQKATAAEAAAVAAAESGETKRLETAEVASLCRRPLLAEAPPQSEIGARRFVYDVLARGLKGELPRSAAAHVEALDLGLRIVLVIAVWL